MTDTRSVPSYAPGVDPLRHVTMSEIEHAVATALAALTGTRFDIVVEGIDFTTLEQARLALSVRQIGSSSGAAE